MTGLWYLHFFFNWSSCLLFKKNNKLSCTLNIKQLEVWFVECTYDTLVTLTNVKVCSILPYRALMLPRNSNSTCLSRCLDMLPLTLPCTGYTHVSDVWFSYTFKMKAANSSCACRVLGSPCKTVRACNVEPELSPRVSYWRRKTWTEEMSQRRFSAVVEVCSVPRRPRGRGCARLLHPGHPSKLGQLINGTHRTFHLMGVVELSAVLPASPSAVWASSLTSWALHAPCARPPRAVCELLFEGWLDMSKNILFWCRISLNLSSRSDISLNDFFFFFWSACKLRAV